MNETEIKLIHKAVVVKYPETNEYVVSFNGYNPSDSECFICKDAESAVKLKNLIDFFVEQEVKRIVPNRA